MNQLITQKREQFYVSIRKSRNNEFFKQKRYMPLDQFNDSEDLLHDRISLSNVFQLLKMNINQKAYRLTYITQLYQILGSVVGNRKPDCLEGAYFLRSLLDGNYEIVEFARSIVYHQHMELNTYLTIEDFKAATFAIQILNIISYLDTSIFEDAFLTEFSKVYFQKQNAKIQLNKEYNLQFMPYWSSFIGDALNFFINIISDRKLSDVLIREVCLNIFNSDLIKIWQWHATSVTNSQIWDRGNWLLLHIMIKLQSSAEMHMSKFLDYVKLQTEYITWRECDSQQSVQFLNKCLYYESAQTAVISRRAWKYILDFSRNDPEKISFFINLTSQQVKDSSIEKDLIENYDILEHIWRWFNRSRDDFDIVRQTALFVSNILTYQSKQLADDYVNKFYHIIDYQMEQSDYDYEICYEFISTNYHFFKYQDVEQQHFNILLEAGYLKKLVKILLTYQLKNSKILTLFYQMDSSFPHMRDVLYIQMEDCYIFELIENLFEFINPDDDIQLDQLENFRILIYSWSRKLDERME
ncbi:hypothetical protein pb186bvf_001922 [Paramecium bursaria]